MLSKLIKSSTLRLLTAACCRYELQAVRCKYTPNNGIKGIRNRKSFYESTNQEEPVANDENLNKNEAAAQLLLLDSDYEELASTALNVTRERHLLQNLLILQPYVKWGPKKILTMTPEQQLDEAKALVNSLPNWRVSEALVVPLTSLDKKTLFGSGKLQELKTLVRRQAQQQQHFNAVFISKSTLSFAQKRFLEGEFGVPVLDRYSVVIQILRLHAKTAEARLQVAMAELPYIWAQFKDLNPSESRRTGYYLTDVQKDMLKQRERKLKQELEEIRMQRKLLRNKRQKANYSTVAVVGYTNAGKTSLIKALTDEAKLQPRDQLFATLDVTAHAGLLPCKLKVIYMDTVGFMSDLPTGLIECFVATLEDAMLANVIVHVQDVAHSCWQAQKQHVDETLQLLAKNIATTLGEESIPPIIVAGNKVDLVTDAANSQEALNAGAVLVSSTKKTGINELLERIEEQVLLTSERKKVVMRVSSSGKEIAWLYKNAAVMEVGACKDSEEHILMHVVITKRAMQQFKQLFINKNK